MEQNSARAVPFHDVGWTRKQAVRGLLCCQTNVQRKPIEARSLRSLAIESAGRAAAPALRAQAAALPLNAAAQNRSRVTERLFPSPSRARYRPLANLAK